MIKRKENEFYRFIKGDSPLIGAAIHDGSTVSPDILRFMNIGPEGRYREEDPTTGVWTRLFDNQILAKHSRFELDLNRPRNGAIYKKPEDAWGLKVWKQPLPPPLSERSLSVYDAFYADLHQFLTEITQKHGGFVMWDIHSYNFRREGPHAPEQPEELNPEINIGTSNMNRDAWNPVVSQVMKNLRDFRFFGRQLDVRENVRFTGGHMARWIHDNFEKSCVLSFEIKKLYMDEWSGKVHWRVVEEITKAITASMDNIESQMRQVVRSIENQHGGIFRKAAGTGS